MIKGKREKKSRAPHKSKEIIPEEISISDRSLKKNKKDNISFKDLEVLTVVSNFSYLNKLVEWYLLLSKPQVLFDI